MAPKIGGFIQNATMGKLPSVKLEKYAYLLYTDAHPASATDPKLIGGYDYNLAACINAGHAKGTRVLLSVFFPAPTLIALVNDPVLFPALVTNIKNAIVNADGVDLDIENYTPANHAAQIAATDALISALYAVLNPLGKTIRLEGYAAMPGQPPVINVSLSSVGKLEVINLMAYDLAYPDHSTYEDSIASLNGWVAAGFPAAKIGLGVPLYAKDGYPTDGSAPHAAVGTYGEIVTALNPAADQNEAMLTTFTSSLWGTQTITGRKMWWNGSSLAREKAKFVKTKGFFGITFFDAGMDASDPFSLLDVGYSEFNPPVPVFLASMGVVGLLVLLMLMSKKKGV